MIIKLKVILSIGYANAKHTDELELEVDDDATDEEIEKQAEELAKDWAGNYIDLGFEVIKPH